MIHSF